MRVARYTVLGALLVVFGTPAIHVQAQAGASRQATPLYQQFLNNPSPIELVAARKADRIAWTVYEEGKRNAYTAAAPLFTPVRLTNFMKDDGTDLSTISISDDGSTVVFLRGTAPNRSGWVANASANPDGAAREIWAARTTGGPAFRVAEGSAPEVSPDGSSVLFVKEGEIYRARVSPTRPVKAMDRGETPFIRNWGTQSSPEWSPDGKKIAFVTNRQDHSFIAVYDVATRTISYMAPDVDFDSSPMWSADGKSIVFVRRPGQSFAQQNQEGGGGIGIPNGPAFQANTGRGGRGGGAGNQAEEATPRVAPIPGLSRGLFKGGYTLSLWKADVATGEAAEVWHNEPNDRKFTTINNPRLAGKHVIFPVGIGGGRGGRGRGQQAEEPPAGPVDEWDRYYSIDISAGNAPPVLLTTTDGLIEDQTSIALSADGTTFFYCTNAKDIDRRHIWAVPVAGGTPWQVTSGIGIETRPSPLASGKVLATMSADWKRPQTVAVWPLEARTTQGMSAQKYVFPTTAGLKSFPMALHVEPTAVTTKAADGFEVPNQLFLPKDIKPGERRPAIVFVHGGPARQMLLGYHYMHFYHWSYGLNQWLANKGYVVLSVNYRSGVGYGRSFRQAPNTGGRGNAEYQDVLAGGKYLQSRPDVDPERIGIWGLSYGGVLTAQALARNSDIFKAGVDLAGVHLWGSSLDPDSVSFKSSAIGAIEGWKSPVLLVHGDDDRNVAFQQTTGLVQLLRQRDVYYELIVFPDDTHESMLHSRWIYTLDRMDKFLDRFLGENTKRITTGSGGR
jgi:dipeptidyl aminopeptidase/acylaminoacyl peptidase